MPEPQANILIVDDEEHIRKIMSIMLSKRNYACHTAASGEEALGLFKKESYDAVFTDLKMPGMDGLELLANLKGLDPEVVVIVLTAFASMETAILAMKAGAYDYISKPFNEDEIAIVLEKALERGRLLAENRLLKKRIGERLDSQVFLGESNAMRKVFDMIAKVADTKATVLITGESGTGKELAARSIHLNSPRRNKPFVAVNCGAIPANLMESEFFGHIKGAFTGADKAKTGLIAEADGGTLFLDEVSDLPLEMQVKFLRVLQEEEYRRVGENSPKKVDLRVLAATNKNLPQEVQEGRFREDLYYRLNVIRLQMPPLRERREDIPMLALHFLNEAVEKHNLGPKRLSPAALKVLALQTFNGNVRALRNVLVQAAIMKEGELIGPDDLFFPGGEENPFVPGDSDSVPDGDDSLILKLPRAWTELKGALRSVTEETEKEIIRRALARAGGNRTKTALILGLSRRTLITKLNQYDIPAKLAKK
ncbi:MAG: sigma-54 dependent transcriptional regulator [Deltaproteobacteria bacterium]|nr:sigma-54 dependent transcriptional regulator [Deltaproteobacteria bacterium]